MICKYCKGELKVSYENELYIISNDGFIDNDTKQIVCFNCRDIHYKEKSKTKYANLYSEIPLVILKEEK